MKDIKKAKKITVIDNLKILIVFEDNEEKTLDVAQYCNGTIFKPFTSFN